MTACNETKNPMKAQKMLLTVKEHKGEKVLYRKEYPVENLVVGENKQTFHIHLPAAKLWSTDSPHLYDLSVSVGTDNYTQRFGFRWFEVKDIHGDKQFFLNGKELFYVQLFHGVSGRIMGSLHLMSWLGDKWRVLKS